MKRTALGTIAATAATALLLSACGGGGGDGTGASDAEFDQGQTEIVNASDEKGGTLRFAISANMENADPGNMYYGYMWNFSRLYARTLYTYDAQPGEAGQEVVPDLAEGEPEVSEDGKTWTVKLKEGLKYEDGSDIIAEDVKYAIARSNFGPEALPNGPKYYKEHLAESDDYEGPYEDTDEPLKGFGGIETPDDHTLVFHLKEPFYDFQYVLVQPQSAPVPADKDKGEQYQQHVLSSGPYKFDGDYTPGNGLKLVRNDQWDQESDPVRTALPDNITVQEGVEQNEIDQRLESGDLDVDLGGTGLGPAKKGELLQDEDAKTRIDNPTNGGHYYLTVNTQVEPFDKLECRQAVEYGVDKSAVHRAWGGSAGGDIANTILPPVVPGHDPESDVYPAEDPEAQKGNPPEAEAMLEECGEDGIETNLGVRSDRPAEVSAAEAIQESLDKVGITVNIKQYPSDTFTNTQAGSPSFVHKEELGLNIYGWLPDWNTGYGYMSQILDGGAIKDAGNSNISELDNDEVNELLDEVTKIEDTEKRDEMSKEIDKLAMEQAVIVPMVYSKAVLYRPDNVTNVFFNRSWKMYDYATLGTTNTG
ncbi:ABC transporter substrate-binding protein [Nocardiopsis suaedae]|uniref:ABC transporter substrate-binding protein n=1 Tax=Nocardiopsis suaedae TaxID=3018444 RepID=A0ABT4TJM1_9ACTN|nr:ABC transporter substrate-binding protein [Nocardiopsis suaedae]MDA2804894.1 ABC transporter substrate-binding protein [Nocardiopsis suaedae]